MAAVRPARSFDPWGADVILQNDWATEAIFKALDNEPTKASKERFTQVNCQGISVESTYEEMHPELTVLMEKFELCY
ncbi:MAG: hypothetical protein NTZ40_14555 [Cyanobacteria bacterium]|nr:hypothetical protein [Cyanobacteriota bacterium]